MSSIDSEVLEGGGMYWPKSGNLWAADGRIALPVSANREVALRHLNRYNAGEYWCCTCKEWFAKPAAFGRFAGQYCKPCAEQYKAGNSRTCLLCRRPIWDCYC